jgi:hypothetical protein
MNIKKKSAKSLLGKNKSKKYEKPLSLHPIKPEEALKLFMQVDPKKVQSK